MKLSMWMIVNRLYNFDLEIHIRDNAPINLRSARSVYATNCVHVYQSENDSVCRSGSDYIIIKDMNSREAVEIIQSVFDYYNDWDYAIRTAAQKMDFQKIIDKSWHIFHNPIVLLNANWNVLAISNRYGEDELDAEWKHLCHYGSSSLDVYTYLKNDPLNNYDTTGAQYYRMNNPCMSNCISSLIIYDGTVCGRINILEKDRELNRGDLQIVNHLIDALSLPMGITSLQKNRNFFSVYHNLLSGQTIDEEKLLQQMEYMGWEDETDAFHIFVLSPSLTVESPDTALLLNNQIARIMPQCGFDTIDNNVVIIISDKDLNPTVIDILRKLNKKTDFLIGKSLKFYNIRQCRFFYNQARFAIRCARSSGIEMSCDILDFYDYAIEFIIRNNSTKEMITACHPDIIKLWKLDMEHQSERLKTFRVYLNNERSLISSAQELYIHRNTLVYRINRILEILTWDLNDVYTRDYMKLSIRILDIYGEDAASSLTIK
ncbi:MAG: helix-turn-helix domain-containing protein [Lachnospiraceae bacterium]|nr:helix-turn-helix domain-containing protein [Lachnospiraceae bacterium]